MVNCDQYPTLILSFHTNQLIHLFNEYILNAYNMPGSVADSEKSAGEKQISVPSNGRR